MRRLATLCISTLLFAVPAPVMAANDGVIVFAPPETQLSEYASSSASAPVAAPSPTRGRYGGGLIEALLTGGAGQSQVVSSASDATEPEAEPEPQFRRQEVDYTGPEAPGTVVVDTPDRFLFLVEPMERRCVTASASDAPASNGRASSGSAASRNGRTGRRLPRCCCAAPTYRAVWRAVPRIRSARERSISAPRSTAFTAPTSRRPSDTTCRQAA